MFRSMNRILRWTKGYHRRLYLGSLYSFLATWAAAGPVMLAAWALGLVIESAQEGTALDPKLPWLCLGGIVLLIILRFVCAYWKNRLQESIGTERAAQQRLELGDLLKRVSLGYFSKNNLGDILTALTTELSTLELQSMKMVDAVINGYLQVLVIVLCMAFFCPEAALVAVVGVLMSAFALRGIGRQSARTAPVGHRAQEALSGAAIEYIHGLSVVKSFGQEGVSSQRFFEACRANKDIRIKNEFGFVPWNCLHLFSLKTAAVGLVLTAGHHPPKDGIVDGAAATAGAGGRLIAGSGFFCRRRRDLRYRRVRVDIVIFTGVCDLCLAFRSRGRSLLRLVRIGEVDHHFTFCFGGYLGVFLLRAGRLPGGIRICSAGIVPVLGAAVRPIAGGAAGR